MRTIIKLREDRYIAWSNICDAPYTMICTKSQIREMLLGEYCADAVNKIDRAIINADTHGTSCKTRESAEDFIVYNRAGENEECISLSEIEEKYTSK